MNCRDHKDVTKSMEAFRSVDSYSEFLELL